MNDGSSAAHFRRLSTNSSDRIEHASRYIHEAAIGRPMQDWASDAGRGVRYAGLGVDVHEQNGRPMQDLDTLSKRINDIECYCLTRGEQLDKLCSLIDKSELTECTPGIAAEGVQGTSPPEVLVDAKELFDLKLQMEEMRVKLNLELKTLSERIDDAQLPAACNVVTGAKEKTEEHGGTVEEDEGFAMKKTEELATECWTTEEFEFGQSIWDAALFIGSPHVGCAGSLVVFLALLINVGIQFIFILIVKDNFLDPPVDDDTMAGLQAWRYNFAHNVANINSDGDSSLAARVCGQDFSLAISTSHMALLGDIEGYLVSYTGRFDNSSPPFAMFTTGPVMSMLAFACWLMTVILEITNTCKYCFAVFGKVSCASISGIALDEEGNFILQNISVGRSLWGFCLCVLRLGVALLLLVYGSKYIATIITMQDVLLNAVALEFVIMIDEMVFEALAPVNAQTFIAKLQPFPIRALPQWRGADAKSFLLPFIILLSVFLFYDGSVIPTMRNLQDAWDMMCNGDTDFVYQVDSLSVPWVKLNMPAFSEDTLDRINGGHLTKALEEVTGPTVGGSRRLSSEKPTWTRALLWEGGIRALREIRSAPVHEQFHQQVLAHLNSSRYCVDLPLNIPSGVPQSKATRYYQYLRALGDIVGETELSCTTLSRYCNLPFGQASGYDPFDVNNTYVVFFVVRSLCPATCGCADISRGTVMLANTHGCPGSCAAEYVNSMYKSEGSSVGPGALTGWYMDNFMRLYAENENSCTFLQNDTSGAATGQLLQWVLELKSYANSNPETYSNLLKDLQDIESNGCQSNVMKTQGTLFPDDEKRTFCSVSQQNLAPMSIYSAGAEVTQPLEWASVSTAIRTGFKSFMPLCLRACSQDSCSLGGTDDGGSHIADMPPGAGGDMPGAGGDTSGTGGGMAGAGGGMAGAGGDTPGAGGGMTGAGGDMSGTGGGMAGAGGGMAGAGGDTPGAGGGMTGAGADMPGASMPGSASSTIKTTLKVSNVDYSALVSDNSKKSAFEDQVKEGVVSKLNADGGMLEEFSKDHVNVELSQGSVNVDITVTPPAGVSTSNVASRLTVNQTDSSSLDRLVVQKIQTIPDMSAIFTGIPVATQTAAPVVQSPSQGAPSSPSSPSFPPSPSQPSPSQGPPSSPSSPSSPPSPSQPSPSQGALSSPSPPPSSPPSPSLPSPSQGAPSSPSSPPSSPPSPSQPSPSQPSPSQGTPASPSSPSFPPSPSQPSSPGPPSSPSSPPSSPPSPSPGPPSSPSSPPPSPPSPSPGPPASPSSPPSSPPSPSPGPPSSPSSPPSPPSPSPGAPSSPSSPPSSPPSPSPGPPSSPSPPPSSPPSPSPGPPSSPLSPPSSPPSPSPGPPSSPSPLPSSPPSPSPGPPSSSSSPPSFPPSPSPGPPSSPLSPPSFPPSPP